MIGDYRRLLVLLAVAGVLVAGFTLSDETQNQKAGGFYFILLSIAVVTYYVYPFDSMTSLVGVVLSFIFLWLWWNAGVEIANILALVSLAFTLYFET